MRRIIGRFLYRLSCALRVASASLENWSEELWLKSIEFGGTDA
jgi:hypothetical protein